MSVTQKVLIEVRGNTHLLDLASVSKKREKTFLNVDETVLPNVGGLEGRFGASTYSEEVRRGKIAPKDEIRVYTGFVNPNGSVAYSFETYYAVNERTLTRGGEIEWNSKKVLQGLNWYSKR
jgi:hypothetical protein